MAGPRSGGAFASLRIPAFRWWFLAQTLSGSGAMAQGVGTAWLVLRLTGSGIDLGLLTAAMFTPVLLGGAWAGSLLDRLDHRRALIGTNATSAALALLLASLTASGAIRVWMVFAIGVANGFVLAFDQPARQLYVVELVGRERVQSAVGLFEVIMNASRVLGPAVGGVMIATLGVAACFYTNALAFVVPLFVLLRFRPQGHAVLPVARAAVREGLRYVRGAPAIVACLLIAGASGMVFNLGVALPVLASRTFGLGGGGYGALMAVFGAGALPGGYAAARSGGEPSGRLIRRPLPAHGRRRARRRVRPERRARVPVHRARRLLLHLAHRPRERARAATAGAEPARPRDGALDDRSPRSHPGDRSRRRGGDAARRPTRGLRPRRDRARNRRRAQLARPRRPRRGEPAYRSPCLVSSAWICLVRSAISSVNCLSCGGELGVRLKQAQELVGLRLRRALEPAVALLDSVGVELVAVSLPRLGEEDQRRRIGGLEREEQVQGDERIDVPGEPEMQLGRVHHHPRDDGDGLPEDVLRRTEEPSGLLGYAPERVVAERAVQLRSAMFQLGRGLGCVAGGHLISVVL